MREFRALETPFDRRRIWYIFKTESTGSYATIDMASGTTRA
jgi:hypothetical protein